MVSNVEFDRTKHTVPTERNERRDMIRWVLRHPIWTVPVLRAPEGESDAMREHLNGVDYLPSWGWDRCIEIVPVWVNPESKSIEDDDSLNTCFRVWIEAGQPYDVSKDDHAHALEPKGGWNEDNKYQHAHDLNLDCGASTMEGALLELALLVKHYYGDYMPEDRAYIKWHQTSEYGLLK